MSPHVSLTALLPRLRPHLGCLADGETWARIEWGVAALPQAGKMFLEAHLGGGIRRIDVGVALEGRAGRSVLAATPPLPRAEALAPLFAEWLQPHAGLTAHAPLLWIEYDLPPAGKPQPPLVHLGLREHSGGRLLELAEECRRRCAGGALSPGQSETLARCVQVLAGLGEITFITDLWHARSKDEFRIVTDLPRAECVPALRGIGWPGDLRQVETLLEIAGPTDPYPTVYLDVSDRVLPRLGVEVRRPAPPEEWPLPAQLVARGLATPEEMAQVTAWGGGETLDLPGLDPLIRLRRNTGVKLVLAETGSLSAKAYLVASAGPTLF